jgi:hypothetical protein
MTWSIWADPISTADSTGVTKFITFGVENNCIMRAAKTCFVFNNVGSFTGMQLKLYASRDGAPAGLIATSTSSWQKSDLVTLNNAHVEVYFEFNFIPLQKDTTYHLVMNCSGYTFSTGNHMAWRKGWPDPIYGRPTTFPKLLSSQYIFGIVSADL